jgi:hypothetical protein
MRKCGSATHVPRATEMRGAEAVVAAAMEMTATMEVSSTPTVAVATASMTATAMTAAAMTATAPAQRGARQYARQNDNGNPRDQL